ncbi:unnamed protein product [Cylindrotheca closterium]|uniref:Uncharacterized protein n=1 Tax=Cylindrotheca closterium TaxID=2856 RepID=A0AAD2FGU0_9STRA|nr:unnamed protein product [Cylindrotheca closterium]
MGAEDSKDLDYILPNRKSFDACSLFTDEQLFHSGSTKNYCNTEDNVNGDSNNDDINNGSGSFIGNNNSDNANDSSNNEDINSSGSEHNNSNGNGNSSIGNKHDNGSGNFDGNHSSDNDNNKGSGGPMGTSRLLAVCGPVSIALLLTSLS